MPRSFALVSLSQGVRILVFHLPRLRHIARSSGRPGAHKARSSSRDARNAATYIRSAAPLEPPTWAEHLVVYFAQCRRHWGPITFDPTVTADPPHVECEIVGFFTTHISEGIWT